MSLVLLLAAVLGVAMLGIFAVGFMMNRKGR